MTNEVLISSVSNPLVRRARKLRARKQRDAEGIFLVEGIRGVRDALESDWRVDHVLLAPSLVKGEETLRALAHHEALGVKVVRVTDEVFASFSQRENPTGVAALVETRRTSLRDLSVSADSLFVILEDVAGPGNLGTIIRTADAAGAGVVVAGSATDPFHPQAVKASMGALFSVPLGHATDIDDLFTWAAGRGVRVLATSARRGDPHWSDALSRPLALMLGSEARGLDDATIARADACLRIPMSGRASSLNLAAAAAVLLYEGVARAEGRPAFG